MSLIPFDRAAILRKLQDVERQLGFDGNSSPMYDSHGRPIDEARQPPGYSIVDLWGRVKRVRQALEDAQPLTLQLLQQDFADLNIEMIWPMLRSLLHDVALYVGGGTLTGAAVGGAVGSLAAGAGAVPGAVGGGIVGGQIGAFVLQLVGIAELIDAMRKFFPEVTEMYVSGIKHAWGQLPARAAGNSGTPINPVYQPGYAAKEIANGNRLMVYALLAGMVAYLMRSGGSAQKLMAEMTKNAKLGPKMAKWLAENEKKLLNHPKLREQKTNGPTQKTGADSGANSGPKPGSNASGSSNSAKSGTANNSTAQKPGAGKGSDSSGKGADETSNTKKPNGDSKKPCACVYTPNPVDAIFGNKFLNDALELDFDLPAPLALAWQRVYSSDNPIISYLGQGWSLPISLALEMSAQAVTVLDGLHREIRFPMLQVGEEFYSRFEQITLSRSAELCFELIDKDGNTNHFALAGPTTRRAQLQKKTDRNHNTIHILYDAQQLPHQIKDSAGRTLDLEFSPQKRLLAISELRPSADGSTQAVTLVSYEYDANGDLICVRNRAGEITRQFTYQNHILIKHAQPGGLVSQYEYDETSVKGRVLRSSTNTGQSWRLAYGKHQTQVSDNLGRNIRHRFDAKKRYLGTVDALGGFTQRTLDTFGNLITLTDPTGRSEHYIYDERSRLLKIEAADGAVTRFSYQGTHDKPSSIIDAIGATTRLRYDARQNLIEVTDPLGQITAYEYDQRGLPISISDARGGNKSLRYNQAGQLTSYTDCSAQTTQFEYDLDGNLTRTCDAVEASTHYLYDQAGRLLSAEYADGSRENYEYDALGRLVGHLDAAGQRTTYERDAEGRVLRRSNALGHSLQYGYDEAKRLAQLINENGAVYAFSYDALDRLVQETGFDTRTTRYQHDAAGRPTAKIEFGVGEIPSLRRSADEAPVAPRAEQIETQYVRDGAGRLIEKVVTPNNPAQTTLRTRYQYDALGRLTFATNDDASVSLEYDAIGQLTLERSKAFECISELRHQYDALGNRIQSILPDGRVLNHLFYGSGHLHQINLDGEVVSDIERDQVHREISRSQGALHSHFQYDPLGRLSQQLAKLDARDAIGLAGGVNTNASPSAEDPRPAGQSIIARQYAYDQNGNLLSIQDQRHGRTSFSYDAIGRILSATQPKLAEQFAFDPAHNLIDSGQSDTQKLGNNQLSVFEDKRYQYDSHGNLLDKKTARHTHLQMQWNAAHQLVQSQITRNAQAEQATQQSTSYAYDPFGRRILKRDAFGETHFIWDGNRLLSETRHSHNRTYLYAGNSFVPLAQVDHVASETEEKPAKLLYFHTDHLGTPRELTDSEGNLHWAATYKAWGNVLQVEQVGIEANASNATQALQQLQALRFQGQYFDIETGLHYNRFRYYDPDIGRFVSQDPIGLAGGNNLYQYAANPSGWIDPLGLSCCHVTPTAHTSGTSKPPLVGGTPNSVYTHIDAKSGKAVQNAIYDADGKVVGHVDFKNHGIESGHWHEFPAGEPWKGHGAGAAHHPKATVPAGWDVLPSGVLPHTPIGS